MQLENMTLRQISALRNEIDALFNTAPTQPEALASHLIGRPVLIRTYSAGVHVGTLAARSGSEVLLTDAVRIWSWSGAFTLSAVATAGVAKGSRISCRVPEILLTEAVELLPVSPEAMATLQPTG